MRCGPCGKNSEKMGDEVMSWGLLLVMSLIIFINRYVFLEPRVQVKFPQIFEEMLKYSAPCLLTAICVPLIFFDGENLRNLPFNAYFLTAVLCIVLAKCWSKILVSLIMSLCGFYLFLYVLGQ